MGYGFEIADVRSAKIRRLHAYWQERCNGRRMPRRNEIDPADLKDLLPDLMVGDFETEPFRTHYRLVGTRLVEIHGLDFTGLYLDELDFGEDDEIDWAHLNRLIFERKVPLFGRSSTPCAGRKAITFEFGTFPLSDDGETVNRWIGIEDYEPLDGLALARIEKAQRRSGDQHE